MARRRILTITIAVFTAAAIVTGTAQARPLGIAEARELARTTVGDPTGELTCVRAVGRSSRPSPRRVLWLAGQTPHGGSVCHTLVDVRSGRGPAAPARAKIVRLRVCEPAAGWSRFGSR
jgi:hypothetical protein